MNTALAGLSFEAVSTVPEKKCVTLETTCAAAGKIVVDGEATLLVPSRASAR